MLMFNRRKAEGEVVPEEKPPVTQRVPSPQPVPTVPPMGFETVLGSSSVIQGTLECTGNIRLDGKFSGTLRISGNVLVGETAEIHADVNANNISVAGTVKGNVNGKKVQLLKTAHVIGDISAASLTTDEGAFIDGKISMTPPPSEIPLPPIEPMEEQPAAPVLASFEEPEIIDAIPEDSETHD